MFVKDYMTKHPVLIEPSISVVNAQGVMADTRTSHLPVVEKGKRMVGLVTHQRLRIAPTDLGSLNVWEITRLLSDLKVKNVMIKRKDVVTTSPNTALEVAAQVMVDHKIGCLPVLDDGMVVGIITETNMLMQLSTLLGLEYPGVRATIRIPDRRGETSKVTSAIADQGWGITVIGAVPSPKRPGYWDLVVKVQHVPSDELEKVLRGIDGQTLIDIRETS